MSKLLLGSDGLSGAALQLALEQVEVHRQQLKEDEESGLTKPCTFVQRLLRNQQADPESITDREINTHAFGNISAGADTTTIALRTIMFHILKTPEICRRLYEEIHVDANLSLPVSFHNASNLPYLNAVIKEALRIHPPTGLMYSREVPAGGAVICGKYIPQNTEVGISPWVLHYDPILFPHPEEFEPERWLTTDADLLARRNRSLFAFSAGPHTCSGKHFSLMEITKLVPSLLLKYDIKLMDPNSELSFKCRWFTPQKGLLVKLTKRNN